LIGFADGSGRTGNLGKGGSIQVIMKNWNFHRLLHSRFDEKTGARMTTTLLAECADVGGVIYAR
jgi:hypothetical protein